MSGRLPNECYPLVLAPTRGMQLPRINKYYETNVGGLYIAGELGGMGLIRNAVKRVSCFFEHALNLAQLKVIQMFL